MKLYYLTNARMPTEKAHGIQMAKMCEAFSKQTEVFLLVPSRINAIKQSIFDYYGIKKDFKLIKLFTLDLKVFDYLKVRRLIQHSFFSLSVFSYALFKIKNKDIIYSRDLVSLWFLSFFRKNLVFEMHRLPKNFKRSFGLLKRISAIICTTGYLKKILVEKGIAQNKILVAHDGVDLAEFGKGLNEKECRRRLNLPDNRIIIGYIGQLKTMEAEKGVNDLIKALKNIMPNYKYTLCLVGGTKEDIAEYQRTVDQNQLTDNVLFVGHVSRNQVPFYLASFDILAMPFPWTDHYAYYMSPLKMFEYMAAKKPIIATDLPSIKEVLNSKNACLVKPSDISAIASAIEKIANDDDYAQKIAQQSFMDVGRYTWDKRAVNILNFTKKELFPSA